MLVYIYIYRFDACGTVAFFVYDKPLSYTALGGHGGIEAKPDAGDFETYLLRLMHVRISRAFKLICKHCIELLHWEAMT